jgi:hypothetical protein
LTKLKRCTNSDFVSGNSKNLPVLWNVQNAHEYYPDSNLKWSWHFSQGLRTSGHEVGTQIHVVRRLRIYIYSYMYKSLRSHGLYRDRDNINLSIFLFFYFFYALCQWFLIWFSPINNIWSRMQFVKQLITHIPPVCSYFNLISSKYYNKQHLCWIFSFCTYFELMNGDTMIPALPTFQRNVISIISD